VEARAEELRIYHALFHDLFERCEQRKWSAFSLCGQLSDLERKIVEPMMLALKGPELAAVRSLLRTPSSLVAATLARHRPGRQVRSGGSQLLPPLPPH
jgi:hypothetical protein